MGDLRIPTKVQEAARETREGADSDGYHWVTIAGNPVKIKDTGRKSQIVAHKDEGKIEFFGGRGWAQSPSVVEKLGFGRRAFRFLYEPKSGTLVTNAPAGYDVLHSSMVKNMGWGSKSEDGLLHGMSFSSGGIGLYGFEDDKEFETASARFARDVLGAIPGYKGMPVEMIGRGSKYDYLTKVTVPSTAWQPVPRRGVSLGSVAGLSRESAREAEWDSEKHPRGEHGKFASKDEPAHSAVIHAVIEPENRQAYVQHVAEELGWHGPVRYVHGDGPKFTPGQTATGPQDENTEAAHFDPQKNELVFYQGTFEVGGKPESMLAIEGIVAHEVEHAKFHQWFKDSLADEMMASAVASDKNVPMRDVLTKEDHPIAYDRLNSYDRAYGDLEKEDGVTAYDGQYWKIGITQRAIDEGLAEISRTLHKGDTVGFRMLGDSHPQMMKLWNIVKEYTKQHPL